MPLFRYETAIKQDAEMLRDGGAAHFEVSSNIADSALGFGEQVQHLPSRAMADCFEYKLLALDSRQHVANIRKHMLTRQARGLLFSENKVTESQFLRSKDAKWRPRNLENIAKRNW